jgi:hypothetical protein
MTRVQGKSKTTTTVLKILRENYLIAEHYPSLKKRGQGRFTLRRRRAGNY